MMFKVLHSKRAWLCAAFLGLLVGLPSTSAASIGSVPVTPVDDYVTVDDKSPMYGAAPSSQLVQPTVPDETPLSKPQVAAEIAKNSSMTDPPSTSTMPPPTSDPPASPAEGGPDSELDAPVVTPNLTDIEGNSTDDRRRLDGEDLGNGDLGRLSRVLGHRLVTNMDIIWRNYRSRVYTPLPWPGSYWPMYQDSINAQWDPHSPSPAEKYARAFRMHVHGFMDRVSAAMGVDSQSRAQRCRSSSDCRNGSKCGRRAGHRQGYCIPAWYGISHGWAPAAILEKEPKCPVTKNRVTFQPYDIKGLMSALYADAHLRAVFLGARYDGPGFAMDEYGRFADRAQRDINPAVFFIAAVNILGRDRLSFVADVRSDAQVRNQPVRSYSIEQYQRMTPSQAARIFFNVRAYPFNRFAYRVAYIRLKFQYIKEMFVNRAFVSTGQIDQATVTVYYEFLLELDYWGNIIGGEWVRRSKQNHPDFIWFVPPRNRPTSATITPVGLSYANVLGLLQSSANGRC